MKNNAKSKRKYGFKLKNERRKTKEETTHVF